MILSVASLYVVERIKWDNVCKTLSTIPENCKYLISDRYCPSYELYFTLQIFPGSPLCVWQCIRAGEEANAILALRELTIQWRREIEITSVKRALDGTDLSTRKVLDPKIGHVREYRLDWEAGKDLFERGIFKLRPEIPSRIYYW